MPKLFLTGYEKETIEEFLDKLEKASITTVIDVREIPLSRKNGFSKNNFQRILEERGIRYYHFPDLGSPSKIREELKTSGDYLEFFKAYRRYARNKLQTIRNVLNIIIETKHHSALLCFEKDCELCHRTILASELLKLNPCLKVTPL